MQTATSETEIKSGYLIVSVHHYTLRAPCPIGQRKSFYWSKTTVRWNRSQQKACIRCEDHASSRTYCLLPLDSLFLARSKLLTRDLEIFHCLLARSAEKKRS